MEISFDPAKRAITLAERGLDFADAGQVFANVHVDVPDDRFDYGEERMVTYGWLDSRAHRGCLGRAFWTTSHHLDAAHA